MTKTITLTINGTEQRPMPESAGGDFAGFRFRLVAQSGATADSEITQETTWVFGNAAPGVYVASVAAIDQEGGELAPPVMVKIVVAEAPEVRTFPAPIGLSYVVSDSLPALPLAPLG